MTAAKERVLVVDDEPDMAESCAFFLDRAGYQVTTANSGAEALRHLDREPCSVVITDVKMPRMSGLTLLDEIRARVPDVEVLLITGFPEVETAVEAMRRGALDYITKPFTEEAFLDRVEKALAHHRVRSTNEDLARRLRKGSSGRQLFYRSRVFAQVVDTLERAARTDASVVLVGESGTGKELLAHHLHDMSPRSGRPFVPLDCTTIPENLVESELFGHVRGAFSGADKSRPGLLHVADKGTLFLDEVGNLPAAIQPKLLRVIQEGQVRRVGAQDYDIVDVRVVCATNRRLDELVERGEFRQDLFYRLEVVRIEVPPLRERREDIELIAQRFIDEFAESRQCHLQRFSPAALEAINAYSWPGNVRQLRNVVERACALVVGTEIELEDLPPEITCDALSAGAVAEQGADFGAETFQEMKARKLAAIERSYLSELLRRHDGNVTRCAEEAGMSRSTFQKLMLRYGIKSSEFRK